ncbi:DNA helicase RecQ [Thiosocius teredinicola]|uniref:DNA helicase RecQ n=1 Tax=Thiosocius teredinicola TaxID=1973002 RepID=UPI000990B952
MQDTDPAVLSVLRQTFGYDSFRPGQGEVIADLTAGHDAFVLMPTGGGKSLCYQVPALVRSGVGIVVSPLIALMKDQVDALHANGVAAACYNSTQDSEEARRVLAQLHNGELQLLYVSPERLLNSSLLERLADIEIGLFAIDEAHCVSQWGHDFRPEYAALGTLRERFPAVPLVALTATADKQTRSDILRVLHLNDARIHVNGFDRPNIRYTVLEKHKPFDQLIAFLRGRDSQSGIVYALSRKRVDEIAERLSNAGVSAAAYHAGMSAKRRAEVQEAFLRDDILVVVATVAFGMGIDKPNVRFVVHYDLPKNIEGYYQETGRAGRDGLPADALLLFGAQDVVTARRLIESGNNNDQQRVETHKLNAMIGLAESVTCRRRVLLNYFGDRHQEDCGNCDVCDDPPQRFDATNDARKALSCVYRVGQRFGIKHVIDVLRGADTERIRLFGHTQLSTYGIGSDRSEIEWQSILRQLIHHGYLEQDIAHYSALKLTEDARPLLRGDEELWLAKPRMQEKPAGKRKSSSVVAPADEALFEELRQLRKQIAQDAGVPPYVVFGDATLAQMARERPLDDDAMLAISGIGQHKLAKYGAEFLDAITAYCVDSNDSALNLTPLHRRVLQAARDGLDLDQISGQCAQTLGDTSRILVELIEAGEAVDPQRLIAPRKYAMIEALLDDSDGEPDLADLRAALPPLIADHEIRLVCAAW